MTGTATEGMGADYRHSPHGFSTSHLDALCHIFHEGKLYNGYPTDTVTAHGATKLGIHQLRAGIVTRGVLLDIPALRGVDALEPGEPIFPEDLEAAEKKAGLRCSPATHSSSAPGAGAGGARTAPGTPAAWRPGSMRRACPGCAAATWPRWAATVCPTCCLRGSTGVGMPIHTVVIVAMGVHLLDNLDLDDLAIACAEEGRWEFLLTVAPLVLRRGTASPVNPIALF